jgi:transglutaminase-like putative cysteine protease
MKLILAMACLLAGGPVFGADNEWRSVDPAELMLKTAKVEKDADAEAIFWEVVVEPKSNHATFSHYIRIKIFTERGRDSQSKVDLTYLGDNKIEDVAGRTIRPDGSIVDLGKAAVFERTIAKSGGLKVKAKSFALPAVEPGAVIEYRWREVRDNEFFLRLPLQRDIPIQSVKYFLKVDDSDYRHLTTRTFNAPDMRFVREKKNLFSQSIQNVPAFHSEPSMPPDNEVRPWMLIYSLPDFFGTSVNKILYDAFNSSTKSNDELRKAAVSIVAGAATPEQRIENIFEFCRARIKNTSKESAGSGGSSRGKVKQNKTASDTLRSGAGTGEDINLLFAALAIVEGFEARLAMIASRDEAFFKPAYADALLRVYFMHNRSIAVNIGGRWRFFDPASSFVPYGMLLWQEEGQSAYLVSSSWEEFVTTPLSEPGKSVQKRRGKLSLGNDGTLEGDVTIEYTGHLAVEMKQFYEDDSSNQREQSLRDRIKERISNAELSAIRIDNVSDQVKPLIEAFHLRAPAYGQRTGKRLFFQPAVFQRGLNARFTASERKYPICFHYPWIEDDEIEIDLPLGFTLDHAESIGSYPIADFGKYAVNIGITTDQRALQYKRNFTFGLNGKILFPATAYAQLKYIFDTTHRLDNHLLALKQE